MVDRDKKPPENKSFHERIIDFSGGLNTTISGSLLNSNEAQVAINTSLEQKGTLKPRRGRAKRYVTPFASTPVTGLGVYYKNDGTSRVLITSNDSVYSDAPHMSTKWAEKADWEAAGTETYGYLSTTYKEGSITSNQQELGLAAKCQDATLWTAVDGVLSTTDVNPYFSGSKAMEILIDTGKTSAIAHVAPYPNSLDSSRWAVLVGYVRRDTATNIKLVGLTSGISVSKSGTVITATTWTKTFVKLAPADLLTISRVGVQITGTANQRAFLGGMYLKYITEDEFNNASYVPPELTYFEAIETTTFKLDTTAEWNEGVTKTNVVIGESLTCVKGTDLNNTQDLSQGTLVDTYYGDGALRLNTNITFVPYEGMTWLELIAL